MRQGGARLRGAILTVGCPGPSQTCKVASSGACLLVIVWSSGLISIS